MSLARRKLHRHTSCLKYPALEDARREDWVDSTTGEFTSPSSIGALLGNPSWEIHLLKFLAISGVGKIGPDNGGQVMALDTDGASKCDVPSNT
jgi:hypothetical protein